MTDEELERIKDSWDDIRPVNIQALDTAFKNGKRDVPVLIAEVKRLRNVLTELGFCSVDGESMPCMTCGAGL